MRDSETQESQRPRDSRETETDRQTDRQTDSERVRDSGDPETQRLKRETQTDRQPDRQRKARIVHRHCPARGDGRSA